MTLLAPPPATAASHAVATATSRGVRTASVPGVMSRAARFPVPVEAGRFELTARIDLRHAGPRDVTVRGEWCGPANAPIVLVAGGISAHRHVAASAPYASPGWWEALAGPHRALDPTCQRLVAINWLGIDGDLDAPVDSADQASAFVVALDHLGIARADAFVGASYGGMVGLQLAAAAPDRLGRLVVVSAAHRPHPYATAWRGVQRRILALGRATGAESEALSLARQLAMLSYRTPVEFNERFSEPSVVGEAGVTSTADAYLEACGARFVDTFHPTAWLRLSESIDLHRVDPATITVPTTAVGVAEDRLVPLGDVAELVAWLSGPGELQVVRSTYGHDAFLKEPDAVGRVVRQALRGIEGGAA